MINPGKPSDYRSGVNYVNRASADSKGASLLSATLISVYHYTILGISPRYVGLAHLTMCGGKMEHDGNP